LRDHYRVTTLHGLLNELDEGADDSPAVVVTFDDGYADNLELAAPIAGQLGVPLTVFVAVGPVLAGTPFWWDELTRVLLRSAWKSRVSLEIGGRRRTFRMSSDEDRVRACVRFHQILRPLGDAERTTVLDQLRATCPTPAPPATVRPLTVAELSSLDRAPGVTIGSHTKSHPKLTSLEPEERESEIAGSKMELEELLGHTVDLLSYPYGRGQDIDEEAIRTAAASGYRAACTTVQAPVSRGSERHALPRRTVVDSPPAQFLRELRKVLPVR
jgi:peptidoglycan/xylan/chitin deacetylase (PgdA/CDA1 family)